MKRCPTCGRTFTNNSLTDCLNDGTPLVEDVPTSSAYPEEASRDYSEEVSFTDFEEDAPGSASSQPAFQLPPFAAPPVMQGTPPPYFAAQLRRKRTPWPSIMMLGILALFVGGLALLIRHDLQKAASKEDLPPAAEPITATDPIPDTMQDLFPGLKLDDTLTQTPDSTLRQSLIAAVKQADAADTQSFHTLNPAPLHQFYAGNALAVELDEIQTLKQAGTTQESWLVAQRFKDFQVSPDHTKAQVDVTETWRTSTRSRAGVRRVQKSHSNPIVQQVLTDPNSQIVSLKRTAHGWVIENIQFYEF